MKHDDMEKIVIGVDGSGEEVSIRLGALPVTIDEMTTGMWRSYFATQVDALVRAGRKSGIGPMLPIWQGQSGPPLPQVDAEIPSVPELRAAYAAAEKIALDMWTIWRDAGKPAALTSTTGGPLGWGEALRHRDRIGARLDDAIWAQRVESWRWLARHPTEHYGAEAWWTIWQGVVRFRWVLTQRRGAPEGFLPSREVAVFDPMASARVLHDAREIAIVLAYGVPMRLTCGHPSCPAWPDDNPFGSTCIVCGDYLDSAPWGEADEGPVHIACSDDHECPLPERGVHGQHWNCPECARPHTAVATSLGEVRWSVALR